VGFVGFVGGVLEFENPVGCLGKNELKPNWWHSFVKVNQFYISEPVL